MALLGLQLYTVMDEVRRDLPATLRSVSQMGYEGVEFPGGMRAMATGEELMALLEDNHLAMIGIVFGLQELEEELDAVAGYCHAAGCDTVIVPWIDEHQRTAQGYAAIADNLSSWGQRLSTEGIRLLYHVHGYEFGDLGGTTGMDILLTGMDSRYANLEIDVYWVEHGGQDAVEFMKRHGSRSPLIHFKDMTDRQTFHDTEVGAGCIDMAAIATLGRQFGAQWFIVEQEAFDVPPMKSVEISLNNLRVLN